MDVASIARLACSSVSIVGHRRVLAFFVCLAIGGAGAQESDPLNSPDPKSLKLAALPDGLRVTHVPNPVVAQPGGPSGLRYTWLYSTTVESLGGPIVIEEFGAFAIRNGQWRLSTYTDKSFTSADFAQWYACADAVVKPDVPCSDPQNWTGYQELIPGNEYNLWYFIGRNSDGRRVKGLAIVQLLAEVGL